MKIVTVLVLLLFASLLLPPPEHVDARAKSYPLVCRGGGAMKARFDSWGVHVEFFGGKQSGGARTLQPGECAWLDRGFLPGEPQAFFWGAGHTMTMMVFFENEGVTKIHASSAKFRYLSDAILNRKVFQVHAYRGECPGPKCNILTVTEVN
ncbi:MAG: hypothetical protein AB7T38_06485 [Nitrospirales bacterium]